MQLRSGRKLNYDYKGNAFEPLVEFDEKPLDISFGGLSDIDDLPLLEQIPFYTTPFTGLPKGLSPTAHMPKRLRKRTIRRRRPMFVKRRRLLRYPRTRRMYGRGGFFDDVWSGLKKGYNWLQPLSKGPLQPLFGLGYGALDKFRPGLGGLVKNVTGLGAYHLPSSTPRSLLAANVPDMTSHQESFEICNKEYLGDFSIQTAFTNNVWPINPGLSQTFPWLSNIAKNFQQYKFIQLLFEFKSTSGSALNSTNAALGWIAGCCDTNALLPPFTTKQQVENNSGSQSCAPYQNMLIPLECAPSQKVTNNLYVRTGVQPSGSDLRMYDSGIFQLASGNSQATYTAGEIWVTYRVRFFQPISNMAQDIGQDMVHFNYSSTGNAAQKQNGLPDKDNVFGVGQAGSGSLLGKTVCLPVYDSLGDTPTYVWNNATDDSRLILPLGLTGNYLIVMQWTGVAANTVVGFAVTTGGTDVNLAKGDTTAAIFGGASATGATCATFSKVVNITSPTTNCQIQFTTGWTLPTAITSFDCIVCKIDSAAI